MYTFGTNYTHVYIYIYKYTPICLLYMSDKSYTRVCIEGDRCTDVSETLPYHKMDGMTIFLLLHIVLIKSSILRIAIRTMSVIAAVAWLSVG